MAGCSFCFFSPWHSLLIFIFVFDVCSVIYPAPLNFFLDFALCHLSLFSRGLSDLSTHYLALIADAFSFIRLGRIYPAYLCRRLANPLLINASDNNLGWFWSLNLNIRGNGKTNRMRKTHD